MGKLRELIMPKVKMPKLPEPARMPDLQDPALMEERRRRLAKDRVRGGRESTIMSDALMGSAGKMGG